MENNLFEPILDQNEKILKVYKPDTKRAWFGTIVVVLLTALWLIPVTIISFCAGGEALSTAIMLLVFSVLFLVCPIIMVALWCKKTVYAVTDKRIIIRTGYIGVDFKSLNYNMLGAITVNVGLWDKILRRNTGTISFGSMSSPLTNQGGAKFIFTYIVDPYQTNKEISSIIDQYHNNKTE